jgi:hypothetical protein
MQSLEPRSSSAAVSFAGRSLVVAGLFGLLAGCASTESGSGGSGGGFFGLFKNDPNAGVTTVQQDYSPDFFLKSGYCPPVQVLPGTESLVAYDKGHEDDAAFIRSQSSITQTARECHALAADTLSIKVGVSGRVLAGPKGGAGTVTTALRVAVVKQHGGTVLFSQAYPVKVTLAAPDFASDYSEVFDQVTFKVAPDDRDLIVYVGFDSGKPKAKPSA